jgi:hypothetical protein
MLTFGSIFFEQVYRFDDSSKRFRLCKLAPRMPATISEIGVARDGGLEYIKQQASGAASTPSRLVRAVDLQPPEIPVNRLVAHVNDQEAGNL